MNIKDWLKILVSASLFLGVGHCCRHGKALNFKDLRFLQSNNTRLVANYTPSVFEVKNEEEIVLNTLKTLPQQDGYVEINWQLLAQTQFKPMKADSSAGLTVLFPIFPEIMRALAGKKVMMRGFVIPIEESGDIQTLVLSANLYATCFFCGKAGPESIMDVRLKNSKLNKRFKQDEKVAFRGTLKLNDKNFDYFNYILEDAEFFQ